MHKNIHSCLLFSSFVRVLAHAGHFKYPGIYSQMFLRHSANHHPVICQYTIQAHICPSLPLISQTSGFLYACNGLTMAEIPQGDPMFFSYHGQC